MKKVLAVHHVHSMVANNNVIVKKAEVDRNATNARLDITSIIFSNRSNKWIECINKIVGFLDIQSVSNVNATTPERSVNHAIR